ncbi:hypothetical protein MTO96_001124 [Rhipicephalus appendiculatus]
MARLAGAATRTPADAHHTYDLGIGPFCAAGGQLPALRSRGRARQGRIERGARGAPGRRLIGPGAPVRPASSLM